MRISCLPSVPSTGRSRTTSSPTGACRRRCGWRGRGDAVLYVTAETARSDPEGFHDRNFRGVPYGVVYSQMSEQSGDPWSVTLSHEAIELIADPQANNYVMEIGRA